MKKSILRSLSIILSIFLILGAIPIGVSAAETSSEFEYSILDDGTIELTRYIGDSSDVILPEEIDGKNVTKVNAFCFYDDDNDNGLNYTVKSIFISKNIKEISGSNEEYFCLNRILYLESFNVDQENTVYSSENGILFNKDKTKLIYYPRCKVDQEYTIPDYVKELGRNAFLEARYLKFLNVSSAFNSVSNYAVSGGFIEEADYPVYPEPSNQITLFSFCSSLTKVFVSKEVNWMNDEDFYGSPNVTLYVYPDSYGLEWAQNHNITYVIVEDEPVPVEKDLVDEETGVQVSGLMDSEATLNVNTTEVMVENAVSAFDITLVKDGNIIQPSGEITITIPSEYDDCKVYWIKDDGTKVDMNAYYQDGKYVFTTDHLSIYALVKDPVPTETVPEPTETVPEPTETVPEPTETVPEPTETVPEPTETVPEPTETVPEPTETVPEPTETVPEPTEPTTAAPVATPDSPSNGDNGSNNSNSNTPSSNDTNTPNGVVATGDMLGLYNVLLVALMMAATTAMFIAIKKRKSLAKQLAKECSKEY